MHPLAKYAIGFVVLCFLLFLLAPFAIVPSGMRGVVTTFGKVDPVPLGEGIHLIMPLANRVVRIDVRVQKAETEGDAASRDLQQVVTKIALNYHLDPAHVSTVYQRIGEDVENRLIDPAVSEVFKSVTARYTAEELITKREEVREQISRALVARLTPYGILVDQFSITNFRFSAAFNQAIEAKVTAEQNKLKAERDLQRIQVEAEQKIASAKAEAESLRLQKQEVTAELLKLRAVENQRLAIEKWDGRLPTVSGGATPLISINPQQ
ncbi:Regulator of protease activity HflC, stomatin/prohibitin superfamily [Andreprevotia lacus DSM 23236]|jgi:regulator of protease activity HflC (stomatin/prohibitin superfamily)|uniref:Regulator of protease activity HflC, stomatin/prohibitin superfamily n=1 Tax=Andreprevotia lacus DSM 23236 TaxID=1121001 RepID=A0A1W1XSG9_9NEIS|nr:prohibitin family protein [Andreprevotia lacus]SMC26910.1 Regulator of protease activity HflC, stomatin/prohibitin superfamily [Andreprevotia lacus DSM 23236]